PSIDNFVAGLNEGSSLTQPISKLTQNISNLFQPLKEKNDETLLDFAKNGLVKTMDKAMKKEIKPLEQTEQIISHAMRFLEQMLKDLDKSVEVFYVYSRLKSVSFSVDWLLSAMPKSCCCSCRWQSLHP
ncbi:MAG: hypothetical protein IBX43_09305, partial [Campylobacterales bacterium]|nr:hypothetical protein [Campylobacterales bacterium]